MASIKEFTGLLPRKEIAHLVAELPYDVVSTAEARDIAADNNYSFYHISKPEIDLPASIDQYDPRVYEKGRENLRHFIDTGTMHYDGKAHLYLYTLVMQGRSQTGLVCGISIDDYVSDIVKKHELTREEKEIDRMTHIDVLSAQTGLVYLLYREKAPLQALFEKAMGIEPLFDFTAVDGVRHVIRVITEESLISAFRESFGPEILYIADGHHRAASSVRVGMKRRAANPDHTGAEDYNYFMGVVFPHNQLRIMPYNRVVKDLNGNTVESLLERMGTQFRIEEVSFDVPPGKNTICMYAAGRWRLLTPKFTVSSSLIESLDVTILQETVLGPILGISDPRKDRRIDFIGGIRGTGELVRLVDSGDYAIAFSLVPTSVDDLISISDAGHIMPPKSTWFEPKLRSGLVVHTI